MAFNLYFAGYGSRSSHELIAEKDLNSLKSQVTEKNTIELMCAKKSEGWKGNLFIDSGAFTAHTKGIDVNVDEYIDYLNSIDEYVHIFAQVDKIPGEFGKPKTKEQILEAPQLSWENYLYMKDKVKSRDKLLPIFHQGEDFKWLKNMLEYRHEDGSYIKYIGISPANDVSVSDKIPFIDKCFKIIKQSNNPNVCTHAFGMTSLDVLEKYPFTSADSTSWIMTGVNGNIFYKNDTKISFSRKNTLSKYHFDSLPEYLRNEVEEYIENHGFTVEDCRSDYKVCLALNILFLKEWTENYKCTYKETQQILKKRKLF